MPLVVLKDHPHHLTKYEDKGTKISIFKLFSELGKFESANSKCKFESIDQLGKILS